MDTDSDDDEALHKQSFYDMVGCTPEELRTDPVLQYQVRDSAANYMMAQLNTKLSNAISKELVMAMVEIQKKYHEQASINDFTVAMVDATARVGLGMTFSSMKDHPDDVEDMLIFQLTEVDPYGLIYLQLLNFYARELRVVHDKHQVVQAVNDLFKRGDTNG